MIIKFLLISIWFINLKVNCELSWDSDIIASDDDIEKSKSDALIKYFGDRAENSSIFLTYENISNIIGNYQNVDKNRFHHHDYYSLTKFVKKINSTYSDITHLYSIGHSVEDRELWVLIISKNPRKHELLKPEFKYVANMHGNEVLGRECLIYLTYFLCKNYGKNDYLTKLMNDVRIHLLFSMNPDGYERSQIGDKMSGNGRSNANSIDLNRNFPANHPEHVELSGGVEIEEETKHVMSWIKSFPFVLSANLHGGSLVANYPFDDSESGKDGIYTPSLDDKLFVQLSYQYARAHKDMWKTGRRCGLGINGDTFYHGITNGAAWYHLAGGMQDWQYLHTNTLEITIEMGCYKFPLSYMYEKLWNDNMFALIAYIDMVRYGLKGIVKDIDGKPLINATVEIIGDKKGKIITTTDQGEYWRLLAPGKYKIKFSHGYHISKIIDIFIKPRELIINDIILENPPCNYSDNFKQEVYYRGFTEYTTMIIGVDQFGKKIITNLLETLCNISLPYIKELFKNTKIIALPEYIQGEHLPYIKAHSPTILIYFGMGETKSIIYIPMDEVPKGFNKNILDESLNNYFGKYNDNSCTGILNDEKLSEMAVDMKLKKSFILGLGLGCNINITNNDDYIKNIILIINNIVYRAKKDSVEEYSVVPSVNPLDHFTPQDVIASTSAGLNRIEESKYCNTKVKMLENMRIIEIGQQESGPRTLIMSIEARTEHMIYQMLSYLCEVSPTDHDYRVKRFMENSKLIVIPEIPGTQLNCHDYSTIQPFEPLLSIIIKVYPDIDYVIFMASGGLKVRYVNASNTDMAYQLSEIYVKKHKLMVDGVWNICSKNNKMTYVNGEFKWNNTNNDNWIKPDALLVQTGCCYEASGDGHLFEENKNSLFDLLENRLQGISGRVIKRKKYVGIKIKINILKEGKLYKQVETNPKVEGYYHVWLPVGDYTLETIDSSYPKTEIDFHISSATSVIIDINIDTGDDSGNNSILIIGIIIFILALGIYYYFKKHNSYKYFILDNRNEGFERIPLRDNIDEDSDIDEDDNGEKLLSFKVEHGITNGFS
ncbi:Carboxypeptidase N catalytic chain [Strongyloides ratti]|uniref:Carboxypeptidase N catalytic chain n=1 Tax=Strongyloides ratti TaxID=34506 RepID=A0A090MXE4_STRRB|nr:Carboxypeptidase N catalytic chain [Strongyloides ratti]CEF65289.1 Carboxypeptidase N catalytic chain [Strongyloides ratti]